MLLLEMKHRNNNLSWDMSTYLEGSWLLEVPTWEREPFLRHGHSNGWDWLWMSLANNESLSWEKCPQLEGRLGFWKSLTRQWQSSVGHRLLNMRWAGPWMFLHRNFLVTLRQFRGPGSWKSLPEIKSLSWYMNSKNWKGGLADGGGEWL